MPVGIRKDHGQMLIESSQHSFGGHPKDYKHLKLFELAPLPNPCRWWLDERGRSSAQTHWDYCSMAPRWQVTAGHVPREGLGWKNIFFISCRIVVPLLYQHAHLTCFATDSGKTYMGVEPKDVDIYFSCLGYDFLMGSLPWKGAQILG